MVWLWEDFCTRENISQLAIYGNSGAQGSWEVFRKARAARGHSQTHFTKTNVLPNVLPQKTMC